MKKLHWAGVISLVLVLLLVISTGAPISSSFSHDSALDADESTLGSSSEAQFPEESPQFNGYSQTIETGKSPEFVRTGDLNNDFLVDLAVCSIDQERIELYFQLESGEFPSSPNRPYS